MGSPKASEGESAPQRLLVRLSGSGNEAARLVTSAMVVFAQRVLSGESSAESMASGMSRSSFAGLSPGIVGMSDRVFAEPVSSDGFREPLHSLADTLTACRGGKRNVDSSFVVWIAIVSTGMTSGEASLVT